MKLVKSVKIFHSKNETGKTIKKKQKVEFFQKHPLGSVTVTASLTTKKICTIKFLRDFIENV